MVFIFSLFPMCLCVWLYCLLYYDRFSFRFRIFIWLSLFCIVLDLFSISDLFFAFSLYVVRTSVLVMVCVIFGAVAMLLIEVSWLMLILSCRIFTEVAWITNKVWITDEPFAVARKGLHDPFFPIFIVMCFLLCLSYLANFLKQKLGIEAGKLTFLNAWYISFISFWLYSSRISFRCWIFLKVMDEYTMDGNTWLLQWVMDEHTRFMTWMLCLMTGSLSHLVIFKHVP